MGVVIQCSACGGAVVYDAEKDAAACLFCGAKTLEPLAEAPVREPDCMIPLTVKQSDADEQFRAWATKSWWYPKELRGLSIELNDMYLPAWHFKGDVETHWAGLVRAATKSGKSPISGSEIRALDDVMPASLGLTDPELHNLQPYTVDSVQPWDPAQTDIPYEVPGMTETYARQVMHVRMRDMHLALIASENHLIRSKGTAMVTEHEVTLYMLPVYIGAFRFRDRAWRFLVNAQTGKVVGDAPIDRVKVAVVTVCTLIGSAIIYALTT